MEPKLRGAAKVRDIIADEHRAMQTRAYERMRPYLAGALRHMRRTHPAFQTVVFDADRANFAFLFGDGTRPHEAPAAFDSFGEACEELAKFTEIEWITADDPIWQLCRGTLQPTNVIEQYRHVQHIEWQFWMRRTLRDARYYMRQDMFRRMFFGSHRPGYGKRIVAEDGTTIDEWIDPIEPLIVRVLREYGALTMEPLQERICAITKQGPIAFYVWDVLRACENLSNRGVLRRTNPKSSEIDAKFSFRSRATSLTST